MNHVGKGGAALALYDLIKELKRNHPDVEPIVITGRHNELNAALTNIGVENWSAPFKSFSSSSYSKPLSLWKIVLQARYALSRPIAIRKIEKLIDFESIDIIHTNLNRIDIGYYFARKYNIPHLWHVREHGDDDFPLMLVFPSYNPIMSDTTSTFIAISKSVKSKWVVRGMSEQNIRLIYDGVDTNYWTHDEISTKNSKLSFVFLGGYHINKGQEIFIQALALLPQNIKDDILVHFYGNGRKAYKQKLKRFIRENDLDNCCRLFDYDPNIYAKLRRYHIGVNCSRAEGFGRITVEYMMAGLCPLVSNCGANVEIVDDQVDGVMFNRDDLHDIREKIISLYHDSDTMKRFSVKARSKAFSSFSMADHAGNIYRLYKHTLS